jgi:hypothetical protein
MSEIKEQVPQGAPQEDKTSLHFETNMKKLVGVLGGKELLTKTNKVKKDVLSTIVENLLKERKEKLELDVKTDLSSLLEKHVTVTKAIADKQKELKDLETAKKKEFNDACNKLFNKVEDIEQLEKDYYASLSSIKKD